MNTYATNLRLCTFIYEYIKEEEEEEKKKPSERERGESEYSTRCKQS